MSQLISPQASWSLTALTCLNPYITLDRLVNIALGASWFALKLLRCCLRNKAKQLLHILSGWSLRKPCLHTHAVCLFCFSNSCLHSPISTNLKRTTYLTDSHCLWEICTTWAWGLQATLETSSQGIRDMYPVTTHVCCLLCSRCAWTPGTWGLAKNTAVCGDRGDGVADTSVLGWGTWESRILPCKKYLTEGV